MSACFAWLSVALKTWWTLSQVQIQTKVTQQILLCCFLFASFEEGNIVLGFPQFDCSLNAEYKVVQKSLCFVSAKQRGGFEQHIAVGAAHCDTDHHPDGQTIATHRKYFSNVGRCGV